MSGKSFVHQVKLSTNFFNNQKLFFYNMKYGNKETLNLIIVLFKAMRNNNKISYEEIISLENGKEIFEKLTDDYLKILIQTEGGFYKFSGFENDIKIDSDCVIRDGDWERIRDVVFKRDNFKCRYCGDETGPFECDHVIPRAKGGLDTLENLVCACQKCNRSKKDKDVDEWLSSKKRGGEIEQNHNASEQ